MSSLLRHLDLAGVINNPVHDQRNLRGALGDRLQLSGIRHGHDRRVAALQRCCPADILECQLLYLSNRPL